VGSSARRTEDKKIEQKRGHGKGPRVPCQGNCEKEALIHKKYGHRQNNGYPGPEVQVEDRELP